MRPELYDEVELICAVPAAELDVGDRATLIDYLEHPGSGESGAVLELSQSLGREQYVVTVPVGAIAALNATAHLVEVSQETPANTWVWSSVFQKIQNFVAKFTIWSDLGVRRR